jgi:hypothetical protein
MSTTQPDQVASLYDLTHMVVDANNDSTLDRLKSQWAQDVREAGVSDLVALVSRLTSDETHRPANIKACREAIISEIERKNTEHLVKTMKDLDKAAGRLTWVALVVGVLSMLLSGAQVWLILHPPG